MTMIEKVARAIHRSYWKGSIAPHTFEDGRTDWMVAARAAIEAMREPSEAMVRAANTAWPSIRDMHANMIDAALNEGEPK